ncbi:MAG: hypothetical protein ACOX2I_08165 [Candidatus Ozemobacteraceae bacterium]
MNQGNDSHDKNKIVQSESDSPSLVFLKKETERLTALLNKQKIDLADAMLELKDAKKQLQALEELKHEQFKVISDLRYENSELNRKVKIVLEHVDEKELQLAVYKDETQKLKNSLMSVRNEMIENLSFVENSKKELKKSANEKIEAEERNEKALIELSLLKKQNAELKERVGFLEFKEKELSDTVDNLYREKSHLSSSLDNLLTGTERIVTRCFGVPEAADSKGLEPSNFSPYIPFCFPEKISALIKFKREVRESMRANLREAKDNKTVKTFNYKDLKATKQAARKPALISKLTQITGSKFGILYFETPKLISIKEFGKTNKDYKNILNLKAFDWVKAATDAELSKKIVLIKSLSYFPLFFNMPEGGKFGIIRYSHDLFIKRLERTLIRDSGWHIAKAREAILMKGVTKAEFNPILEDNFFNETLAFRYRLSIESHMYFGPREEMKFSYLRQNKLKSVLTTFGKTFASVVKTLETNSSSARNDETVKK